MLVLILLVSGREDRPHKLLQVLTAKLADFTGIQRTRGAEKQTFLDPTCSVMPAVPDRPGASFLLIPARSLLVSAVAWPGFKPLGHVLVQLIIV